MVAEITVLIVAALLGGIIGWRLVPTKGQLFKNSLVFSGAYLFSLTIIHLIPELFETSTSVSNIGLFILLGFFLQIGLEYFTDGVEHGHLHQHNHGGPSSLFLVIALCLHALLDGTILSGQAFQHAHVHQHGNVLLIGLALHKIPAALALMTLLKARKKSNLFLAFVLGLFTLASPLGLIGSEWIATKDLISDENFVRLFAIVSGSFLQISTTIFFESTPGHRPHPTKLLVALTGAALAVITEMIV